MDRNRKDRLQKTQTQKDRLQYETIDLRLIEPLNRLRPTPLRDPKAFETSRIRFLEQLEEEFPSAGETFGANTLLGKIDLFRIRALTRPVFTSVVIILLVLVFLFSGASITARASQSALPGEPLYAIKTSLEQTQLRFSVGISQQVGLYLSFASNRLNEMDGLIQIGRYSDAILVSDEFCSYLAKAFTAVDQLEQLDPVQAARLSSELSVRISAFSTRLGQMASKLPDVFQTRLLADIPFPVESVVVQHTGNGTQPQDLSDDDQNLRGRAGNMVDGDQGLTASTPAADESTLQQDWGAGLTQDEDNRIKQHGPAPSQDEAVSNEITPDGH